MSWRACDCACFGRTTTTYIECRFSPENICKENLNACLEDFSVLVENTHSVI